jgi:hypothetical protein
MKTTTTKRAAFGFAAAALLLALAGALHAPSAGADVSPGWHLSIPSKVAGSATGAAMATASHRDLYLVATLHPSADPNGDLLIARCTRSGAFKWSRVFRSPTGADLTATGIAVDKAGNVVVVGGSQNDADTDWLVVKYSLASNRLWYHTVKGSAHALDVPTDVRVNGSGQIYVAGVVTRTAGGQDGFIRKYTPGGKVVWSRAYDGSAHGSDRFDAMALDGSGNVYVAGAATVAGSTQAALVARYLPSGMLSWSYAWSEDTSNNWALRDVAVNTTGVAVIGDSSVAGGTDGIAGKFSLGGVRKWTTRVNGSTSDSLGAVGMDASGQVVGAGSMVTGAPAAQAFAVMRFGAGDGSLQPVLTYAPGGIDGSATALALAVAPGGVAYATGYDYPSGLGGGESALTVAEPPGDTAPTWSGLFKASPSDHVGTAVVYTPSGVFVAGAFGSSLGLMKYAP